MASSEAGTAGTVPGGGSGGATRDASWEDELGEAIEAIFQMGKAHELESELALPLHCSPQAMSLIKIGDGWMLREKAFEAALNGKDPMF
jgi:hypothetical protein